MFNITNYQKTVDQNYHEVSLHSSQIDQPSSKSLQTVNDGEGVKKREPSHIVGRNASWYSHYRKQ